MQEKYMKLALKEAKKAYDKKEIPVGAVIVKDDKVIAKAHNLKELKNDTTKHAEIIAIQKASKKLNSWRLENCEMYVTLEPCSMCAGALIQSRIKKVYIGTMDYKTGACGSVLNLLKDFKFNLKEHFNSINTPIGNKEIKPYLHGGTENSIGTISFNLDDIEIDTKEIIDLETNELDIELLSSEEIENMYKEDTNNANSI